MFATGWSAMALYSNLQSKDYQSSILPAVLGAGTFYLGYNRINLLAFIPFVSTTIGSWLPFILWLSPLLLILKSL